MFKQLVSNGEIEEDHLERMAGPGKMNVRVVWNRYHHNRQVDVILEKMLKPWYNQELFGLKRDQCLAKLAKVVSKEQLADIYNLAFFL